MAKKVAKKSTAKVGVGVGVAAALVSAAGTYFLYGAKNAAKHRTAVKHVSSKVKKEVAQAIEKAKGLSKNDYEKLVDNSIQSYKKMKGASAKELTDFAREMKAHWKSIEQKGEKVVVKPAAKAAQKGVKVLTKTAKKAVKTVGKTVASVTPAAKKSPAKKTTAQKGTKKSSKK